VAEGVTVLPADPGRAAAGKIIEQAGGIAKWMDLVTTGATAMPDERPRA
jgi:hypothetical protein